MNKDKQNKVLGSVEDGQEMTAGLERHWSLS